MLKMLKKNPLLWPIVLVVVLILLLGAVTVMAKEKEEIPRTAFVHLFEWSWTDIEKECTDFLGPKGFAAVLVSPPYEHASGNTWWVRYQPVVHELSTSRSGTKREFKQMVKACKKANVDIYVDAVFNHVARLQGRGSNGSPYDYNTREYPQYGPDDFHESCSILPHHYSQDKYIVQNCSFTRLPDLKTESDKVRKIIIDYMNSLIEIGVAGFRIDAAKHIPVEDLTYIYSQLKGNPYIFHEVLDHGGEAVSAWEYVPIGDNTEVKYSSVVSFGFTKGRIADLNDMFTNNWMPSVSAVTFIDNHDRQRKGHGGDDFVPTYKEPDIYALSQIFHLAYPYGYPMLMSGYSFTDTEVGPPLMKVHGDKALACFGAYWVCEHRWPSIAAMVEFKNWTQAAFTVDNYWSNGLNQISFSRGDRGFVAINRSASKDLSQVFETPMPDNTYCNVIDICSTVIVVKDGKLRVDVPPMDAVAIHIGKTVK